MGKKRDLYRGTVEKRGKNTWRIRVSLGWDKAEKKYVRSPSRTVHGTKAQAYEALEKYKAEIRDGADLAFEADITVDKYAQMFHAERKDIMNSPLAYEREGLEVGKIADLFEDCLFDDLSAFYIRQRYNSARKGGMSQSELHKVHTKFKQILQQATEDRLIPYNPCQSISVPRPEPKDNRNSLTKEEAQALRKLLEEEPITAKTTAVYLGLQTGMRRGEVLGLLWENVHLEVPEIYVCLQYAADMKLRPPKSKAGVRRIRISKACVAFLERWKEEQKRLLDTIRMNVLKFNPKADVQELGYLIQSGKTPVITNELGKLTDPNIFSRWFRSFCAKHGYGSFVEGTRYVDACGRTRYHKNHYRGLRFHELRHTQATFLIGAGTDIKTVQHRLGHNDPYFTAKIYAHAMPENDQEAADMIGDILDVDPEADDDADAETSAA